jgi:carbonic anhydrase
MLFSRSSVTAALVALTLPHFTSAADGVYSYDSASPFGPANWGDVVLDNNQCNGRKNSPIAVEDPGCTIYADYNLNVSVTEALVLITPFLRPPTKTDTAVLPLLLCTVVRNLLRI